MNAIVICVLAFVALAIGKEEGIDTQSNHATGINNLNPYTRLLRIRSIDDLQICEPGSTKMDDCNECFCAINGWACTRMGCGHRPIQIVENPESTATKYDEADPVQRVKREEEKEKEVCVLGTTKMEDCNSCYCAKVGWACTRMECIH